MEYKRRQRLLKEALLRERLHALLVTHLPNVRYLTGFTGSSAALLVSGGETVLFTDGRYATQANEEVQGAKVVISRKTPTASAGEWLENEGARRRSRRPAVGIEGDHLVLSAFQKLRACLATFRMVPASPLVESLRIIKDRDEVQALKASALLGSRLFDGLLASIRPGTKETEAAGELEYCAVKSGAEGMSFPTIIASGSRSALPHGRASSQPIPPDGFVVCDFGVILSGYCSDMTRTVYVGQPNQEARRIYRAVKQAQEAAVEAVRPGRKVAEVDGVARKVLQKEKLGRYFTHSTGHGVGLEIHEAPRVAAGQDEILQSGMVITIEPGVYIPGKWGVRIEDMVVVTAGGCEVLTPTSKELIAL